MEDLNQPSDIIDDPFFRKLAWQTVAILFLAVVGIVLLAIFLKEPVTAAATSAVKTLGIPGIIAGVIASDVFGFPVPPSTYLFAAVAAGSPVTTLLILVSLTSIISGTLAYLLGPWIGKLPILCRILERFRPRGEVLIRRWGVWAVGVAAITPLPFPILCWLAGIYQMPYKRFFATTLLRAPRMIIYYALFALGWTSV